MVQELKTAASNHRGGTLAYTVPSTFKAYASHSSPSMAGSGVVWPGDSLRMRRCHIYMTGQMNNKRQYLKREWKMPTCGIRDFMVLVAIYY
jgi:hypothetical protein